VGMGMRGGRTLIGKFLVLDFYPLGAFVVLFPFLSLALCSFFVSRALFILAHVMVHIIPLQVLLGSRFFMFVESKTLFFGIQG